jgi:hypothetical protein
MRAHTLPALLALSLLLNGCPKPDEPCEPDLTVVINEVMVNPDGQDTGLEWIELYNSGDQDADASGWSVAWFKSDPEDATDDARLPADTVIPAGGFLLLGGELMSPTPDIEVDLDLGNGADGDGIHLINCEGNLRDALVYGDEGNEHGILDESGSAATSVAPKPSNDETLARVPDGADTDASAEDFGICAVVGGTPGGSNAECQAGGGQCDAASAPVRINEVMVDPDGADTGYEWVELVNTGAAEVDVSGWAIEWYKSDMGSPGSVVLPSDTTIAAGGFLLVGDAMVPDTDVSVELDMGQGTHGDALWLVDCGGDFADGMAYGDDNADEVEDEPGHVAITIAAKPGSGRTLARFPDGDDTDDSAADFCLCEVENATPGAANEDCCGIIPPDGDPAEDVMIVVNEFLANPDGDDSGHEWIELYNAGPNDANLTGWVIRWYKGDPTSAAGTLTIPDDPAPIVSGGGFLLIGGEFVVDADVVGTLDFGQGTNGDAVHLSDGFDTFEDGVVYGDNNDELMEDEPGQLAASWAAKPSNDESLARIPDGQDSGDSAADFSICSELGGTPGATNAACQ